MSWIASRPVRVSKTILRNGPLNKRIAKGAKIISRYLGGT